MGIFDKLFGKKETPSETKKECCSKEKSKKIEHKYKKIQEEINIDLSKMEVYPFLDLEKWGSDIFKNHKNYDYYLIISDLHEGGHYQLKKSDTNNDSEIISEFQEHFDPSSNADHDDNILLNKIKSEKFPELFLKKINEFVKENGKDDMYGLLIWLDEELGWINYESCEFLIESLGLNRDLHLEFIFEHMLEVDYPSEITKNPNIISFGGYELSGEMELFLGVCEK